MASSGVSAFGTSLLWNYSKVVELTNISANQSATTIDITNHDSDSSYEEFVAGVRSGGEVSLEGNLITSDPGQTAFHTDIQNGTKRTGYIVLPMSIGQAMKFEGVASGFSSSAPYNDKLSLTGSIQISGKPVLLTTQSTGISALSGIEETLTTSLSFNEDVAAGTYSYTCSVDTASTWVKLTVTAASHSIYVNGTSQTSATQGGEIALGEAGTTTSINIVVFETNKSPRIYNLAVTRG